MKPDKFEQRLRDLPWSRTPAGLRARIFGEPVPARGLQFLAHRRVPLAWAAVFVALAAGAGFWAGRLEGDGPRPSASSRQVEVIMLESEPSVAGFGLHDDVQDPWPGPMSLTVVEEDDPV